MYGFSLKKILNKSKKKKKKITHIACIKPIQISLHSITEERNFRPVMLHSHFEFCLVGHQHKQGALFAHHPLRWLCYAMLTRVMYEELCVFVMCDHYTHTYESIYRQPPKIFTHCQRVHLHQTDVLASEELKTLSDLAFRLLRQRQTHILIVGRLSQVATVTIWLFTSSRCHSLGSKSITSSNGIEFDPPVGQHAGNTQQTESLLVPCSSHLSTTHWFERGVFAMLIFVKSNLMKDGTCICKYGQEDFYTTLHTHTPIESARNMLTEYYIHNNHIWKHIHQHFPGGCRFVVCSLHLVSPHQSKNVSLWWQTSPTKHRSNNTQLTEMPFPGINCIILLLCFWYWWSVVVSDSYIEKTVN